MYTPILDKSVRSVEYKKILLLFHPTLLERTYSSWLVERVLRTSVRSDTSDVEATWLVVAGGLRAHVSRFRAWTAIKLK